MAPCSQLRRDKSIWFGRPSALETNQPQLKVEGEMAPSSSCPCADVGGSSPGRRQGTQRRGDQSHRNWKTEQPLRAPAPVRKVPVPGHTATDLVPSLLLHPFAKDPQRKSGFLGEPPPHFQSGASVGTPAPAPPPPAAKSGCERHRLAAIPEVTRSSAAGAPLPTDTPFLRRRGPPLQTPPPPPRPSVELQLLTCDVAQALTAFPTSPIPGARPASEHASPGTARRPREDPGRQGAPTPRPTPPPLLPAPRPPTPCIARAPKRSAQSLSGETRLVIAEHARPRVKTPSKRQRSKSATLATTGVRRPAGGPGGAAAARLPLVLSSTTRILKQ